MVWMPSTRPRGGRIENGLRKQLCHTPKNAPILAFKRSTAAQSAPDAPQSLPALLRNGTAGAAVGDSRPMPVRPASPLKGSPLR